MSVTFVEITLQVVLANYPSYVTINTPEGLQSTTHHLGHFTMWHLI